VSPSARVCKDHPNHSNIAISLFVAIQTIPNFPSLAREIPLGSFTFSRSGDTVHRKVHVNLSCGITLRSTFIHAPPHGVFNIAEHGGGDVDRGVVSALPGHHILEILGQISGRVSLEEVIEFNGIVRLGS